jgi:hypothetical protein
MDPADTTTPTQPPLQPATQEPARFFTRFRRADTYGLLFLLLLLDLAFAINSADAGWTRTLSAVLTGFTLVLAVRISHAPRRYVQLGWVALVLAVAAAALGEVLADRHFAGFVFLLITFELALAIPVIVQRLLKHNGVSPETVAGALCIYLLAGMVLASLLCTLSLLSGHEYLAAAAASHGP